MRVTAVTCVRNEGPFLIEWIAWNRLIGVTDFLFYSNDCTDGTDRLLDALARAGVVRHRPNPAEGRHYQMEALKAAARAPEVQAADWVWIADVDEFLSIHAGDGTIPALVAACGDPQAISVSWRMFANAGVERFEDRPVVAQFTRTHDPDIWCGETAIQVKTLVRRDFPLQDYGPHRPVVAPDLAPETPPRWTDAAGRPVPERFVRGEIRRRLRKFPAKGARAFATLNHYPLRSLESFLVKVDRGDVNLESRRMDVDYWRKRDDDACAETRLLAHLPALEREMAALKALPGVGAAHEAAVAAHRARIAALLEQAEYRALRARLRAAPRISEAEEALIAELGLEGAA